jgi:hypothetical protein
MQPISKQYGRKDGVLFIGLMPNNGQESRLLCRGIMQDQVEYLHPSTAKDWELFQLNSEQIDHFILLGLLMQQQIQSPRRQWKLW